MRQRSNLREICVAAPCCAILIYCSLTWTGLPSFYGSYPFLWSMLEMLIYLPVLWAGRRVFLRAIGSIAKFRADVDIFTAAVIVISTAFSLYGLIKIATTTSGHEYIGFAPCSAIILTALVCDSARSAARPLPDRAAKILAELIPSYATVVGKGGDEQIPVPDLKAGDLISLRPGEVVPCDGVIIAGLSDIDESVVDGSLAPATKLEGDTVYAGTKNLSGYLTVRVDLCGVETVIGRAVKSCFEGTGIRRERCVSEFQHRFLVAFSAITALIAGVIFAIRLMLGLEEAVSALVGFLMAFCPCGFVLAGFGSVLSIRTRAASEGLKISDSAVFDLARKVSVAVIDKVGTATVGRLSVTEVISVGGRGEDSVLRFAAALSNESQSRKISDGIHRAICDQAALRDIAFAPVLDFEALPGQIRKGTVDGRRIILSPPNGNDSNAVHDRPDLSEGSKIIRSVYCDGLLWGFIGLSDKPKPTSAAAINALRDVGISPVIMTADQESDNEIPLGADRLESGLYPREKAELVMSLRAGKGCIAVIGDGVSDCAALSCADVGIAPAAGSQEAKESAGVVLLRNDLRDVLTLISLSKLYRLSVRIGLFTSVVLRTLLLVLSAVLSSVFGTGVLQPFTATMIILSTAATAVSGKVVSRFRLK